MTMLLLLETHDRLMCVRGDPKMGHLFHSAKELHLFRNMFLTYLLLYSIDSIISIHPTNNNILLLYLLLLFLCFFVLNRYLATRHLISHSGVTFLHSLKYFF